MRAIVLAVILVLSGDVSPLHAQVEAMPCQTPIMPRAALVARLASGYGETKQTFHVLDDNVTLELFASQTTGSWTILRTFTNGTACAVASGHGWRPQEGKRL